MSSGEPCKGSACLVRAAVAVASLPCYRCHKKEGRQPESPAAPSVPGAEDNHQDSRAEAHPQMKDAFPLLDPELQLPLSHLEGKAPRVPVDLCHLSISFCRWFFLHTVRHRGRGFFFFLDCSPQMSRPNPDAVVFVCCCSICVLLSALPQLLTGNCLVSAIEHQFQREDCGFISYSRMTRKYVLCEHSRSLFFLVYTPSMKHVNMWFLHICL